MNESVIEMIEHMKILCKGIKGLDPCFDTMKNIIKVQKEAIDIYREVISRYKEMINKYNDVPGAT